MRTWRGAIVFGVLLASSQVHALEKCRFERKRVVHPPGAVTLKVFASDNEIGKFSDRNKLFVFLKETDGKTCVVDWAATQTEMEDWLAGKDPARFIHEEELNALLAGQSGAIRPRAASVDAPAPETPATKPRLSSEARMREVRERIGALKDRTFDSASKRRAEVDRLLKLLEES